MAEMVVSAIVGSLFEKLASVDLMKLARIQGIDSHLHKWESTLRMIHAILADASKKQITDTSVELWLNNLHELAYDIDDVLDDLATEAMRRDFKESRATSSKVLKMIPTYCSSYTPRNIIYSRKLSPMLDKITIRLNDLFEQKRNFGLSVSGETSSRTNKRLEETSLLPNDVSEILGREGDEEALLEKLMLGDEAKLNVIDIVSIVGMGGIGKTTLARLLYNDQKVKDHFEVRAWVCVSDDFDVFNISKQIYQAVVGEDKTFASLELLHVALEEQLLNKRFLLVLDDVWSEDHKKWEALKRPLKGAAGSKVIVTTRHTMVATVMGSVQPYNLGVLSEDIALSLFAQYALEEKNFDKHPSLSLIARGIVKKCGGLPLALVTIGRVLKTKGSDDVEWEELLNSDIWSSEDGSDILPALKLSYYHLPSHLKHVFAYCSLYPKDHQFDKNKLVLKWMAQGFLSQPKGGKSMEILGHGYFEELRLRCFFQSSTNDKSRYTMHDLMHDLAIGVAGKFFFMLDDKVDTNRLNQDFEKFRHFSFLSERGAKYSKFKELHRARCLRTFLPVPVPAGERRTSNKLSNVVIKLATQLQFLRVLSLTDNSITKVPKSIGNLKHLRYLNFSNTNIKHLPKQVCKLYNLQSLLVGYCNKLCSLPTSLVKLKNLRHLEMTGTRSLKKLPLGIGGLTSLQTLSKVVIQGGNGFKVSELKGLSDLQGALSIEGLDKVKHPNEANDANLQQKKGLDNLDLVWSDVFDDSRNPTIEYEVLEELRPPCKLKKLKVLGYGGMKFPSWLGDPSFNRLIEVTLRDCENCTELATLEHLTSLEKLEVSKCPKLVSIKGVESSIMGSLKQVTLYKCDSLESYCCPNSVERLEILSCSSITSLSFSKSQEYNLKFLWIFQCENIKSISEEHLQSLTSLEEMWISSCPRMEDSFPSSELLWPPNLRELRIGEIKKPMSEWGAQNYPSSLVEIILFGKNSGVVSFGIKKEKQDHVGNNNTFLLPPSLTSLRIIGFEEVESVSEVLQHLPHLRSLYIRNCPKLRDVPHSTSSLYVHVSNY